MAGSVTIYKNNRIGNWRMITLKWTSDGSGDVADVGSVNLPRCQINSFLSLPGASVTDEFDLTIPTEIYLPDGSTVSFADMLFGAGADLSNSTNGEVKNLPNPVAIPSNSRIEIKIANAGATKSGHLWLIFWEED